MTAIKNLATPCFLVDLDILERNIAEMAALCKENGHSLCPMVKTHKCSAIALLQKKHGARSFLAGTPLDVLRLAEAGIDDITLPYPVAGEENISNLVALSKKCSLTLSFDGFEAARAVSAQAARAGITFRYLIIIDCGLHRFGIPPSAATDLARRISELPGLEFAGISTHPGQAYSSASQAEVESVAITEIAVMEEAARSLREAGFPCRIIATGSTPTVRYVAGHAKNFTLRPGNYVFNDGIQVALGTVPAERCSLTVQATLVANPSPGQFLMDAGSKSLGLDKGGHSVSLMSGYGMVKGHPEVNIESLSEEVGKLRISGETSLQVGDVIEIIPNHSCSTTNMTDWLVGHRNGVVERLLAVDSRSNSLPPAPLEN